MEDLTSLLRSADSFAFWITALAFAAGALASLRHALQVLGRHHTLLGTPTSRLRSSAQGYVELSGYGDFAGDNRQAAPLTGTPSIWYRYEVAERLERGRNGEAVWRRRESGTSDTPFLLRDGEASCLVDPRGAEVIPAVTLQWYGRDRRPRRRPPSGWYAKLRLPGQTFRYRESRLHPGEPLHALGSFRTIGGGGAESDAGTEVRERLRVWKRDRAALLARFDENRNGVIDGDEWEAAREAAQREVHAERSKRSRVPPVDVLGKSTESGRCFLLSALPEEALSLRLRRQAAGFFALFVLSGSVAGWMVSTRLGM